MPRQSPVRIRIPADPRPRADVGDPFVKLVGGWHCLDFVNTVRAWLPEEPDDAVDGRDRAPRFEGERLGAYEDLVTWAEATGSVGAEAAARLRARARARPGEARSVLRRAHALRGALHGLAAVCLAGRAARPADLDALDAERRRLARGERLVERDGRIEMEWRSEEADLDAPLWPVVRSAVSLFTDPEAVARLGRCDGELCGWLFADFGRGRRRRWCDMADCGNVAKVRAHRARARRGRTRRSP